MNTKLALGLVAAVIVVGAGGYYVLSQNTSIAPVVPTTTIATSTSSVTVSKTPVKQTVSGTFPEEAWVPAVAYFNSLFKDGTAPNYYNFCHGQTPFQPAADIASLQIWNSQQFGGRFFKDKANVWIDCTQLVGADPATITVLPAAPQYEKDATHVWARTTLISGADPASFVFIAEDGVHNGGLDDQGTRLIENDFDKDRTHVYYVSSSASGISSVLIPQADPGTFSLLHIGSDINNQSGYEKDKATVYWGNQVVTGADAATFTIVATSEITPNDEYKVIPVNGIDARDKNHTYLYGKVVQ